MWIESELFVDEHLLLAPAAEADQRACSWLYLAGPWRESKDALSCATS